MKKAVPITLALGLILAVMVYLTLRHSTRSTHMHFSTRGGVLKQVVYYSSAPPETAAQHRCDGKYADMLDHLYETHLELWRERYAKVRPEGPSEPSPR